MSNQNELLAIIERAYDARVKGDKEALPTFLAPGATFRLIGSDHVLPDVRLAQDDAAQSIGELIDRFIFHSIERLDAVIEARKVAVRWKATLSIPGGSQVTTELFDLWSFNDDLKVTSIVQFADTALIATMRG